MAYLSGTPYDTWKTGTFAHEFTDTDPTHDPDNDGLTNQQEFAFGLDPTSGSSNSPVEVNSDLTAGTFRYTRWAASGLTYVVRTSDDLVTWSDPPAEVIENVSGPNAQGVETVEVTLTSPPSGSPFFVRVEAY